MGALCIRRRNDAEVAENVKPGFFADKDLDPVRAGAALHQLERKRDLLELMERCSRADGIKIFIGEEAGFDVFGDFSVITAPYAQGSQSLGVLGVIGPTRMAYEQVIPVVDVTARMLSAALSR